MTAEFAGEALTFWVAPETVIEGLIGIVALPEPSEEVSAVTANCCRMLVAFLVSGWTLNTLAMVKTSPRLSTAEDAVQPLVTSEAPVWAAPLTTGLPALVPTVWVGHSVFS